MGKYRTGTDSQRQKVYDAERVLRQYSESFDSIEECFDYMSKIIRRKSVREQFPRAHSILKPVGGKPKMRPNNRRYYDDAWRHHKVYGRNKGLWVSFGNKYGGSYWHPRDHRIQLAGNHMYEGLCIHELCHGIVDMEFGQRTTPHGRKFCHTYLWVVRKVMGKEAHAALKASFQEHGVVFTLPFKKAA